jgi:IS4 transposase
MRFTPSIFGKLIEPISRGRFKTIVERHDGDAYDKAFTSWDHLLALLYAQLSGAQSLRALAIGWNANSHQHYHLGSGRLARSTLSDASRRRPAAVFAEVFALIAAQLDRHTRSEGAAMLRLIDSTPIPLGKLCAWARSNGRIRGMKLHIVYDPDCDCPRLLDITDASRNDAEIGRTVRIEKGATYVFDKGYCHYGWWTAIASAQSTFVTRPKSNMGLTIVHRRPLLEARGEGFTVLDDIEVSFSSKGDSRLAMPLRRLRIERQGGGIITLLTNDLERSAIAIAQIYKSRWQIELLFRWIKQHLKIGKFLGNSPNAVRLQVLAAMIAYGLLRIAARVNRANLPILRFTDLVTRCLFERRSLAAIERPPPVNPGRRPSGSPLQMSFTYA